MSDTQHTPGPWLYKNTPGAGVVIKAVIGSAANPVAFFGVPNPRDISFSINDKGELLASIAYEQWVQFPEYASRVCGVSWDEMQAANGRLIAAAPELVAACRAMLEVYGQLHARFDLGDCPATDQARNAIAKAKGD